MFSVQNHIKTIFFIYKLTESFFPSAADITSHNYSVMFMGLIREIPVRSKFSFVLNEVLSDQTISEKNSFFSEKKKA